VTDLPRLALLADYHEEGWTSMDLCAEMLADRLRRGEQARLQVELFRPPFRRRLARLPLVGHCGVAIRGDRLLNRMWDYPRALHALRGRHDLFHLCDHSYAQLLHELPPARAGVFCHDLDTFRCLLNPRAEPRPRWFRAVARRILTGLQKAALVFHTTRHTGQEIERLGWIDPGRLVLVPYGLAPEFTAEGPDLPAELAARLPPGAPFLLHVGSCIPRKRIDVLLAIFAAARPHCSSLCLVKVGGAWTGEQQARIKSLGIADGIIHLGPLAQEHLAPLYRRATLVLVPSEQEGFGLPVIEALACGAVVVASDLPTLREAGGAAALYRPCGDVTAWTECVASVLADPAFAPPLLERILHARTFTWEAHARTVAEAYTRLALEKA
jgi:glycosyltransferase involved in cell wall biosynthesis